MKIDHIAIYVCDLEGARDFFVRYFGAKPNAGYHNVQTGFLSFFLSFDDNVRLEVMTRPQMTDGEKERNRKGFIHLSFSVGSKEQVDTLTCSVLNKLTLSQSKRSKNLCLITMNQRKYCYYISM